MIIKITSKKEKEKIDNPDVTGLNNEYLYIISCNKKY